MEICRIVKTYEKLLKPSETTIMSGNIQEPVVTRLWVSTGFHLWPILT
jgi:hypothetical protein